MVENLDHRDLRYIVIIIILLKTRMTVLSLNIMQMKVLTSNNDGFIFYAGGSAMIDNSADSYGAIIYGYTETEVLLWRPDPTTTNGYLVYVDGQWGAGNNNQQSTLVEVTVQVISLSGVF